MLTGNEPINPLRGADNRLFNFSHEGDREYFENTQPVIGLTIRQHFASIAPEVPEWFQPTMEPKPLLPTRLELVLQGDDLEIYKGWYSNETNEWYEEERGVAVPKRLKDKVEEHRTLFNQKYDEILEWDKRYITERFFQWRTFYANGLIAELNKNQNFNFPPK